MSVCIALGHDAVYHFLAENETKKNSAKISPRKIGQGTQGRYYNPDPENDNNLPLWSTDPSHYYNPGPSHSYHSCPYFLFHAPKRKARDKKKGIKNLIRSNSAQQASH